MRHYSKYCKYTMIKYQLPDTEPVALVEELPLGDAELRLEGLAAVPGALIRGARRGFLGGGSGVPGRARRGSRPR